MKRLLIGAGVIFPLVVFCIYFAVFKLSPSSLNGTDLQGTYLEGIVTNQDGKPVSGVHFDIVLGGFGAGMSDRKGKFRVQWQSHPFQNEEEPYLIALHRKKNLGAIVKLEQNIEKLNIRLKPAVAVTGFVTDTMGKAIRNAKTHLIFWSGNIGTMLSSSVNKTDRKGRFKIPTIPTHDQKYILVAEADGYGRQTLDFYYNDAMDGLIDVGKISLDNANQSVSGIVVDINDKPVANADISAYGDGQPQIRGIRTDAQGKFIIDGICKGNIQIYAHARDRSPVEYGLIGTAAGSEVKIVISKNFGTQELPKKESPLLVGKTLPDLSSITIDYAPEHAEEKMLLVCFIDFEQRPSRNCILQLSKRAQELKVKEIVIVAIQASKIEQAKLNEWIKENNIPFPVGIIEADSEKVRYDWGVKSFPWLILADKQHIVQAEGFSPAELDEKLNQIKGGKIQ